MLDHDIALDEHLDYKDPLRHLMNDHELEGIISAEGLLRASSSRSELLDILPQESHSIRDGILKLSFMNDPHNPMYISLSVDASPGCGGLAWPAGQILASYLVQKGTDYIKNRNILELGSGTGLVGLVAGKLGGDVCITDQVPLLPLMHRNILLNDLESRVIVAELNWGMAIPTTIQRPDLILAADCVYFEPAFPLLVQTLSELSDSRTEILFSYKKRRKADKRFFTMLKKNFTWKEVTEDPNHQIYNREALALIRLSKIMKPVNDLLR
ncbi:hypothetical protein BYT27DRAFT_7195132 [Phlegmacium glaucopus]|nr:hypothetical protein BYT27DRAFT_7195132 [Phlegmacium glaucopus]